MKVAKWEEIANYIVANFSDTSFTKEDVVDAYGKISGSSWNALVKHGCICESEDGVFSCASTNNQISAGTSRHRAFSTVYEGVVRAGMGDYFSKDDLPMINKYYFAWKDINIVNKAFNMRRLNLPELLSEGLACALMENWVRTNDTSITNATGSGDVIDLSTGEIIQIKGVSSMKGCKVGPTSFGPRTEWDVLVCVHIDCNTDTAFFYLLTQDYKSFKVNADETVADQQAKGLRPRLILLDKIKEFNITPFMTYQFTQEE